VCEIEREREKERERERKKKRKKKKNCLNIWQLLLKEKLNFLMNNKITISHEKLV
jgi:hypothetical protein